MAYRLAFTQPDYRKLAWASVQNDRQTWIPAFT